MGLLLKGLRGWLYPPGERTLPENFWCWDLDETEFLTIEM